MSETGAGRHVRAGDSGQAGGMTLPARPCWPGPLSGWRTRWPATFDVADFLHGLSEDSVEILRAAAAGVMLADARGGLRLIASSDERMRLLELFEIQGAQGPCLDAYSSGRPVQATAAMPAIPAVRVLRFREVPPPAILAGTPGRCGRRRSRWETNAMQVAVS